MRTTIFLAIVALVTTIVTTILCGKLHVLHQSTPIETFSNSSNAAYIGSVKFDYTSIRLIILKHSIQDIADIDGNEAIEAVNVGSAKGLNIRDIGNYWFDKNGPVKRAAIRKVKLADLKDFISKQMKIDATPGDTFIIYTIGHGSKSGYLDNIGQRKILFDAFSSAAAENHQETFWWQLSCYAAANLPAISTLPEDQQQYFSMLASSESSKPSYFKTQGAQMEKVFTALAENNKEIDPNQDHYIVGKEFANFLDNHISRGKSKLFYTRDPQEVIFGYNLAHIIPIVDRNNPQEKYPQDYIPMPR